MEKTSKELLKEFVNSQHFTSTTDIMNSMKELFSDVLQTVMEERILALYSCGMSRRDISEQIKNLYNVEISDGMVSKIVEKIMPEITAWQNRPLDAVYPFIFMDAIHYKVKENHQYITKAA